MLHILIKNQETLFNDEYISHNPKLFDEFFNNNRKCLQDPFIAEMLKIIEHSKLSEGGYLEDEEGILYSPFDMSTGMKSLILLYFTDYKLNGSQMGDNCYQFVLKIAKQKDIYIHLGYIPEMNLSAKDEFEALIMNYPEPKQIKTWGDFIDEYVIFTGPDYC